MDVGPRVWEIKRETEQNEIIAHNYIVIILWCCCCYCCCYYKLLLVEYRLNVIHSDEIHLCCVFESHYWRNKSVYAHNEHVHYIHAYIINVAMYIRHNCARHIFTDCTTLFGSMYAWSQAAAAATIKSQCTYKTNKKKFHLKIWYSISSFIFHKIANYTKAKIETTPKRKNVRAHANRPSIWGEKKNHKINYDTVAS